jgi:hypothetical protein
MINDLTFLGLFNGSALGEGGFVARYFIQVRNTAFVERLWAAVVNA